MGLKINITRYADKIVEVAFLTALKDFVISVNYSNFDYSNKGYYN